MAPYYLDCERCFSVRHISMVKMKFSIRIITLAVMVSCIN
uniref:Uncharacterized protein n=1 Tax=Rhizophora mucronata TaxID=61149 RepID=A0A2P2N2S5_RHIMU